MILMIFSRNFFPSSSLILSFAIVPWSQFLLFAPSLCTDHSKFIRYGGSVNTISDFSQFISSSMVFLSVESPQIILWFPSWYISPFCTNISVGGCGIASSSHSHSDDSPCSSKSISKSENKSKRSSSPSDSSSDLMFSILYSPRSLKRLSSSRRRFVW